MNHNFRTKQVEVKPISSINQEFPHGMADPHFSDERFEGSKPISTFLAEGYEVTSTNGHDCVDDSEVIYLHFDHLLTSARHDESGAFEVAKRVEGGRSKPLFYEEYLKAYFDDEELKLVHILAGVQAAGNGMPYWALGFKSPVYQAEQLQRDIDDIPF